MNKESFLPLAGLQERDYQTIGHNFLKLAIRLSGQNEADYLSSQARARAYDRVVAVSVGDCVDKIVGAGLDPERIGAKAYDQAIGRKFCAEGTKGAMGFVRRNSGIGYPSKTKRTGRYSRKLEPFMKSLDVYRPEVYFWAVDPRSRKRSAYVGDAVLGLAVAIIMVADNKEGEFSDYTKQGTNFKAAKTCGLSKCYPSLDRRALAELYESIVAATYFDGGLRKVLKFVRRYTFR